MDKNSFIKRNPNRQIRFPFFTLDLGKSLDVETDYPTNVLESDRVDYLRKLLIKKWVLLLRSTQYPRGAIHVVIFNISIVNVNKKQSYY